jgi:hypothetical protein
MDLADLRKRSGDGDDIDPVDGVRLSPHPRLDGADQSEKLLSGPSAARVRTWT